MTAPPRRSRRDAERAPAPWGVDSLARIVLFVHLALAPMLFGGAQPWTIPIITATSTLAALVAAWAAHKARKELDPTTVLVAWVAACLFTGLQAIELPCSWVSAIAPRAAAEAETTARVFGSPALCAISEDPGATREEFLKHLAIVCTMVATSLSARVTGSRPLAKTLLATTVLVTATSLVHRVLDATTLYGVIAPAFGSAQFAPFANPNHLGGIAVIGVPLAIGLATGARDPAGRSPYIAAFVLLALAVLSTLSRGAIAAATVAGFAAWILCGRRAQRSTGRVASASERRWQRVAVGLLVTGVVVAAGVDSLREAFVADDASKLQLTWRALEFALVGPWLGIGRGAFAASFVGHSPGTVRFEYPENFLAQWLAEWGIVAGSIFAVGALSGIARTLGRPRRPESVALGISLAGYLAQNLVDFGTEMLGSMTLAAALFAVCIPRQPEKHDNAPSRRSLVAAAVTAIIGLVGVATLGQEVATGRVDTAREDLGSRLDGSDRLAFLQAVQRSARLHPREPILPLLAASEAARHRDPATLRYATRAIQLAPTWAAPHVVAAQYLASRGLADQARIELRQALTLDFNHSGEAACGFLQASPTVETLLAIAPRGPTHEAALSWLVQCFPWDRVHQAEVAQALLEREPSLVRPRYYLVNLALRERRTADAAAAALPLASLTDAEAQETVALVRMAEHDYDAARTIAMAIAERDPWRGHHLRARIEAEAGDLGTMREVLRDLHTAAGTDLVRIGEVPMLLGQLELAAGNDGRALTAFETAYREHQREDALPLIADLAAREGNRARAVEVRGILCAGGRTAYCATTSTGTP